MIHQCECRLSYSIEPCPDMVQGVSKGNMVTNDKLNMFPTSKPSFQATLGCNDWMIAKRQIIDQLCIRKGTCSGAMLVSGRIIVYTKKRIWYHTTQATKCSYRHFRIETWIIQNIPVFHSFPMSWNMTVEEGQHLICMDSPIRPPTNCKQINAAARQITLEMPGKLLPGSLIGTGCLIGILIRVYYNGTLYNWVVKFPKFPKQPGFFFIAQKKERFVIQTTIFFRGYVKLPGCDGCLVWKIDSKNNQPCTYSILFKYSLWSTTCITFTLCGV